MVSLSNHLAVSGDSYITQSFDKLRMSGAVNAVNFARYGPQLPGLPRKKAGSLESRPFQDYRGIHWFGCSPYRISKIPFTYTSTLSSPGTIGVDTPASAGADNA